MTLAVMHEMFFFVQGNLEKTNKYEMQQSFIFSIYLDYKKQVLYINAVLHGELTFNN